jgi:hypothetical protein
MVIVLAVIMHFSLKILSFSCFCLLVSGLTGVSLAAPSPDAPVFACTESAYDAGRVAGNVVEHVFQFRNNGKLPLTIDSVRSCCGVQCSVTTTNLLPGASGEFCVRVDLTGRRGKWRKAIYVQTNDPARSIFALQIAGTATGPGIADEYEDLSPQTRLDNTMADKPARR